jgi:hypothetical protein
VRRAAAAATRGARPTSHRRRLTPRHANGDSHADRETFAKSTGSGRKGTPGTSTAPSPLQNSNRHVAAVHVPVRSERPLKGKPARKLAVVKGTPENVKAAPHASHQQQRHQHPLPPTLRLESEPVARETARSRKGKRPIARRTVVRHQVSLPDGDGAAERRRPAGKKRAAAGPAADPDGVGEPDGVEESAAVLARREAGRKFMQKQRAQRLVDRLNGARGARGDHVGKPPPSTAAPKVAHDDIVIADLRGMEAEEIRRRGRKHMEQQKRARVRAAEGGGERSRPRPRPEADPATKRRRADGRAFMAKKKKASGCALFRRHRSGR